MVIRLSAVRWAAVCMLVFASCAQKPLVKSVTLEQPQGIRAPVTFTAARDGLPSQYIWKTQLRFGDVNGDGFADVAAVSRLADGPYVWLSDGQGQWTNASDGLPRETFCGGGTSFGDINNDGKTDLAIADHCKGVYAFFGDGAGHWTNASSGLPTVGSEDVALGDFNNDGCLDVAIVTAQEEGIRAYTGNCKGVWRESSDGLPLTEWGNGVVLADINGDGNLDIAAAYAAGPRVFLGDGKGAWNEASAGLPAPEIHGLYWGIAVGDVNNDGRLDLASGAAIPGAEVFLQQPDGSYVNASTGITPMNALGVALGDLDKDGNLDLVVAGKTALDEIGGVYGTFAFKGDGQGHWAYMEGTGLPKTGKERTWGVGLGDINGDGILDIGAAFGDVLSPAWRSGVAKQEAKEAKNKPKGAKDEAGPQRGRFGSIDMWLGHVSSK